MRLRGSADIAAKQFHGCEATFASCVQLGIVDDLAEGKYTPIATSRLGL